MRAIVRATDAARVPVADVVRVSANGLAALASEREDVPEPSERELRAHERITRQIHDSVPSLPARFGSVFADDSALADALGARRPELATTLEMVGARVEMSVTLPWRAPRPRRNAPQASSGRAYLDAAAKREHERREAQRIVARLLDELPGKRALTRQSMCPRDGVAAIVAFLVEREEVNALRQGVESFARRSADVSAEVYGPMPPYSFVS